MDGITKTRASESAAEPTEEGSESYYRAHVNKHHEKDNLSTPLVITEGTCTEITEALSLKT